MTPSGIEPATFRFIAQHLNDCATAVPEFCLALGRKEDAHADLTNKKPTHTHTHTHTHTKEEKVKFVSLRQQIRVQLDTAVRLHDRGRRSFPLLKQFYTLNEFTPICVT